jgi:hypothetical protein
MRMVGEPLCQVVWEDPARLVGTAFWLNRDERWPESRWPWLGWLAKFLVEVPFNRGKEKYRVEALERNLEEPAFVALFDTNDPELGKLSARQGQLFDWLEA